MNSIELLKKLGMTEYEARAYLSLAKLGTSTVKEIVLDSKLPRNKAYEALSNLEQKNKVLCAPMSPRVYTINNPENLKEQANKINSMVDNLIETISKPRIEEFKELFWIIKGRQALIDKFAVENLNAQKEICSFSELDVMPYKNFRIIKEKIKDGVQVKFLTLFNKKYINKYNQWLDAGVKIRVLNENIYSKFVPRITVIDNGKARLTIGRPEIKEDKDFLTLWTESRTFASFIKLQFESMWNDSNDIEEYLN